jgi:hypothetical protein
MDKNLYATWDAFAWRTNDAKNDLRYDDFVALCRAVVRHHQRVRP